jgi:hypothetical protein
MSTDLAERRKGRALMFALIAAALAGTAAVTVAIDGRSARQDSTAAPAVPGLSGRIAQAQRITVTSAEASYRIEAMGEGDQRRWVMRDRGDYAVAAPPLARLTDGLEDLQLLRRMTSDPEKHPRLGVDDPREGGRGVLIQIEDGNRALLVDLILGVEPNGGLYVRRTGQNQVWSARGDLPPLRDVAQWMDLSPIQMDAANITRVEITPAEGPAYIAERPTGAVSFALVSPRVQVLAASTLTATAERLSQLAPIDVQVVNAIAGPPRGRVRVFTADMLVIEGELVESDGKTWIKLIARGQTPETEPAALAINERVAGWAYALSRAEVQLAPPLRDFLPSLGGGEE